MTTDELRKKYLDFFISKQHRLVPSDSLIPRNDPTLLFTGAGMNQFKEEFLGRVKDYCRATTCQKCLRTPDLENVGKTAGHHTFFEMLGNFSFGDYFKKEAITWSWEFLTKELGLSVDKLVVSVYEEDDEAFQVWHKEVGLPLEKIYRFNAKENYWPANAPADGPNGPCGPCSEIFYDRGAELSCGQPKCDPSCGCDRYVEIWNLVFTQFDRQADGSLKPLPNKNIDTGMGLERMAAVIQGVKNNFQIDIFKPVIEDICKTAQIKYNQNPAADSHVQAIADHIRAVTFIIGDGALGSNEGRGYVLRSLIRRSIGHGRALGIDKNFLYKLVAVVVEVMKEPYPQLLKRRENIAQIVESEEKQYDRTLKEAQDILEDKIKGLKDEGKTVIPASGDFAFELYDTYGLPVDITEEIVSKGGFSIDREQFNKAMKSRQEQSRQGSKMKGDIFGDDLLDGLDKQHLKTAFVGYDKLESECEVIALYKGTDQVEEAQEGDEIELVLDKTSFYGETGGQAGDKGVLKANGLEIEIADVKKIGECILHIGQIKKGKVSVGLKLKASVGAERRMNICRNHTATHLLHWALRTVLGEHVQQAGSMVAPDRLRFDFTHFKEVTKEQLIRIEDLVNTEILNNALVKVREMDQQEAIDSGAIALFGEKYAQKVRVVSISDFSSELCGGTHLDSIGQIGIFKIISESSIASGTRRIEALTGPGALEDIKQEAEIIEGLKTLFKIPKEKILNSVKALQTELRQAGERIAESGDKIAGARIEQLLADSQKVGDINIIIGKLSSANMNQLRRGTDTVMSKAGSAIVVLGSSLENKVSVLARVSDDVIKKGVKAKEIIDQVCPLIDGRGGGKEKMAQGGGTRVKGLDKALEQAKKFITEKLV